MLLTSELTLSLEPDSFKWTVALVESPAPQPTVDPLSEINPEPEPAESRVIPPEPTAKPVQQQATQRQVTHAPQEVPEVIPVNQTASTVIAQAVERHEVSQILEPVTTQEEIIEEEAVEEEVVEEEPPPVLEATSNEDVMSVAKSPISQPTTDSVNQQPPVETASETSAQVPQPSAEQLVASAVPFKASPAAKADYGWLMRALLGRIDELKNYPVMARMNRWEGKVILRAVIRDDGQVLMVDVQESSGRSILDNDAMETLKKASPLKLDHPLGKPQVAILMPISYSLR
ncbi:MAG: TonB family protein [Nitrospira sp.]|nr:TonB family protein [Nitrospira sp.]